MDEHPPSPPSPKRTRNGGTGKSIFIWSGITLVGAAVISLFAFQAWLENYLKSEPFRLKTQAAIGRVLHAEVQLAPLQHRGTTLSSESAELTGNPNTSLKSAKVQSAQAELDLGGLWRRTWVINTLTFQHLDVNFGNGPNTPPDTSEPSEQISKLHTSGLLASLLPNRTEIALIQTDRASFSRAGAELRQTRLEAKPTEGGWSVNLSSGDLHWPGIPAMTLSEARFIYKTAAPAETILRQARVLFKTGGQSSLSGQSKRGGATELHAQLENVDVHPFLPEWWQARLHGNLQGNLLFSQASPEDPGELTGELRLSGGKLEALPLLSQLDSFLGVPRFRQVPLKTASARLRKTATSTEFQDLDLDADGTLRLRGNLLVEAGQIRGSFKLGISPALLQWLPGTPLKIFPEAHDGYVWAPFEISGSLEHPVEDLSNRLAGSTMDILRGTVNRAVNEVKSAVEEGKKEVPNTLPGAAKSLIDAAKSLIPK
jgi:hypothetical protein